MKGADGSGVHENKPNLTETGKTTEEPITLLAVAEKSSEQEPGEIRQDGEDGEMRNGLPELITLNIPMPAEYPSVPQSTASPRSISHPQLGNIPSASEIRRILGSLISHNSLGRNGTLEKATSSVEPRAEIQNLLTDEICNNFARQMRAVEEQRGALPLNGTFEPSDMENTKAPRTVLMSEKVRLEDYRLLRDHNKNSEDNTQIPIPLPAFGIAPAIAHEAAPTHCSSTPSDEEIAIPFDSKFFPHAKGMEREEGEITSKASSVTSDVSRWTSPPKRYSFDEGRRSRRSLSPEPAMHRLPPSRTYYNRSPERFVRPSSRRSQSPSHPRRPISPPLPERPRRRRSTPGSKIPYAFGPGPPRSPRSATHKRRGSDYDTRRSKDSDSESYLSRDRDSHYNESLASPYLEGHKDAFIARDGSNHDRKRGSTQERGYESVESSHAPQSKPSINSNDHNIDHRRSLSGGPTASPSSITRSLPDASKFDSDSSSQVVEPCHNVPGLWMVKSGRTSVEIVTCEFEIDKIAADRWGIRGPSRHGKEKAHDTLSLSLACVSLSEIVALQGKLDLASATPQEIANEMGQIATVWPPAGHLVVQINHDQEWGRTWLPRHLEEEQSSIDIVNYVHEGTNVIRLIQLAGLVDHMFMVLAKEKPPDMDTIGHEPEMEAVEEGFKAMEEGSKAMEEEPGTMEQLLKSFVATTQTIYSQS